MHLQVVDFVEELIPVAFTTGLLAGEIFGEVLTEKGVIPIASSHANHLDFRGKQLFVVGIEYRWGNLREVRSPEAPKMTICVSMDKHLSRVEP